MSFRFSRAFIGLAAAAIALTGLAGCSSPTDSSSGTSSESTQTSTGRTVDQIKSSGEVTIGVFSDKSPFGYVDANGTYQGYDVVYANRIGKDLGVTVKFVPLDAAARVSALQTGKVDIVLANFTVTADRAKQVDFANPYMKVSLGVASPVGAEITDPSQLAGKTVIVVTGTTAETYLETNNPDVQLQKYDQYNDATNALLDGRGDAWVTDNTEALAWTQQNPGFTTGITTLGPADTIAGAVQKGNTSLLTWLNDELVTLGQENFFHEDYKLTLEPVYGTTVSPDDLVVEGGKV